MLMRNSVLAVAALSLTVTGSHALSQQPADAKSDVKATARLTRDNLAYFAGHWKSEREAQKSPFGPAGKITAEYTCEWFDGKEALRCESKGTWPAGEFSAVGLVGFDSRSGTLKYLTMSSKGAGEQLSGVFNGETWVFSENEVALDGKSYAARYVLSKVTPEGFHAEWQISADRGKTWKTVISGQDTRVR